jgi:hypothetical protein
MWFKNLARTRGKLIIIAVSNELTDPFKKLESSSIIGAANLQEYCSLHFKAMQIL